MTRSMLRFAMNFRAFGGSLYSRMSLYRTSTRYNYYRQLAQGYAGRQLLHVDWVTMPDPAVRPEFVAHLKLHVPDMDGFRSKVFTYVESDFNPVYGDFDPIKEGAKITTEVIPSGQRGRLKQIFAACPKGSYGYYAQFGLAPFRLIAGNLAAATIDEFFGSNIEYLKQEMSPATNDIMTTLETKYWRSQKDIVDWLAGMVLTKFGRTVLVAVPAALVRLWEGRRVPDLPPGQKLTEEQLADIATKINAGVETMDLAASLRRAKDLYQEAVKKNRIKYESEKIEE